MSCFHCSADWRYISAHISAGGGGNPSGLPPPPGNAFTFWIYFLFGISLALSLLPEKILTDCILLIQCNNSAELQTPKKLEAWWRVAGNTVSNLTGPGNEAWTFRTGVFTTELTGRFYKFHSSRKCWKYVFIPELQYHPQKNRFGRKKLCKLS